jgi:hypothetical protein
LRAGLQGLRDSGCRRRFKKYRQLPLLGLCAPSEYSELQAAARHHTLTRAVRTAPPMRFAPLQRLPAQSSGLTAWFASPHHLRPQVFSTSRRFRPPCACRPCFMPNPLMGLHPSELSSSRAAVRRLQRQCPLDVDTSPSPTVPEAPPHVPKHAAEHPVGRASTSRRSAKSPHGPPIRGTTVRRPRPFFTKAQQLWDAPKRSPSLSPCRRCEAPRRPTTRETLSPNPRRPKPSIRRIVRVP